MTVIKQEQIMNYGFFPFYNGDEQTKVKQAYGDNHMLLIDTNGDVSLVRLVDDVVEFIESYYYGLEDASLA